MTSLDRRTLFAATALGATAATVGVASPASATSATGRMAAVQDMARLQRLLFEVEREFVRRVRAKGVSCTVRDTRGREIAAACGQLAAEGG